MSSFRPNLFKSFEEKGEWWLPNNPDRKVVGTVSYTGEERTTLELVGSFFDRENFNLRNPSHPRVILGLTNRGEQITLLENVHAHSGRSSRGGAGTVKYRSNYIFTGAHFRSPAEMMFNSCHPHYTYLEEWVGKQPFEFGPLQEGDQHTETITYREPKGFEAKIPNLNATISSWHGIASKYGDRRIVWKHTVGLSVEPEQPRDFIWFRKVQYQLRNLLSLLIGYPVYLKRFEFVIEHPEEELTQDRKTIVSVHYPQQAQRLKKNRPQMLVPLSDIEGQIATILEAWFSQAEKLEDVYQLFIGAMYSQKMYEHLHFLTLMQALETYHRSTREGQYIQDDDYQKVYAALMAAIPAGTDPDLRMSLKSRIHYGNEYALRKRIKLLLEELGDDCRNLITKNPKDYVNRVIDTRNYLTHYDRSLKPGVLDGADLYNANLSLTVFLTILLLKELGIEEAKIAEILSRHDPVTRRSVHLVEFDDPKVEEIKQLEDKEPSD